MDSLVSALSKTVEIDAGMRQEAEQFLEDNSSHQGFCPLLLKIAVDRTIEVPPHIRLSAAVYLKNTIGRLWKERTDREGDSPYVISPEDKQLMRGGIIDALVLTEDNTVKPLCYCLELISRSDFPKSWPELVIRLRGYLETDSVEQWRGAALAVYQVGRKYQFKQDSERGEFLGLIQTLLPLLHQRCSLLIEQETDQSYYIQHFILKSVYYVINCHLPLSLFQDHILHQWFPLWLCIISKPVPTQDGTMDVETRAGAQWWKCKKWALRTLYQLIVKYFDIEEKKYLRFKKFFNQHYSEKVVTLILQQLDQHTKGTLLTDATLQISLSYLAYSISHSVSWKLIRPHFEPLFLSLLFPLMCHSQKDQLMWDEDPAEYIRIRFDIFDDFLSPVSAGESLVQQCVQKRRGILDLVLQHCMRVLGANQDEWNAQRTDGALHVISCSCDAINENKIYREEVEGLFVRFVFPLFLSPVPYLRARACWMFHSFERLEFSDGPNLPQAVEGLMRCLIGEKELPVRVEAAIGVLSLFDDNQECVDLLKPHVGTLLRELLLLVKETENDDIADALRDIIRIYGEDISGIAVELCGSLVQTFSDIYEVGEEGAAVEDEDKRDDAEFSKSLVGMGILNSILSLCTAMSSNLQLLSQLESCISNLLAYLLRSGVMDLYEEVFQILERLTDEQVSSGMWGMLFLMVECFHRDGFDYFQSMMPSLYNFVSVDEETFLSDSKHMECVLQMCTSVLENSEEENAQQYACKMLEIVLLNLKGKVDPWLPAILTPPMLKLTQTTHTPELRTQCLVVVIAALFTSPDAVLQLLESTRFPHCEETVTSQLLTSWVENPDQFDGIHDRKISLLALCSLLRSASGPQLLSLQQLAPKILPSMVQLLTQLIRAYEENETADSEEGSAGGDAASEGESGEEETPESDPPTATIVSDGEDALDEKEASELQKLLRKAGAGVGEEESSESSDLELATLRKTEFESEYETLVDVESEFDEFVVFRAFLESLSQQNPPLYSLLLSQISVELQEQIQTIFKVSEQHWQEIQSSKQTNEDGASNNSQ